MNITTNEEIDKLIEQLQVEKVFGWNDRFKAINAFKSLKEERDAVKQQQLIALGYPLEAQ